MASLPCSAPATLALHSQQLAFGSFTTGPPDVHQAVPVALLASPFCIMRFARRRTRQQALPRVPAGECEIVAKTRLVLQVRATAGHGLTIRSSRVRFAASAQCGNLLHHAKAANRPGLAQALGNIRDYIAPSLCGSSRHPWDVFDHEQRPRRSMVDAFGLG